MSDEIQQTAETTNSKGSDEDILAVAKQRFNFAVEAEAHIREEAVDDLRFRVGDQWDPQVRADRERERRPCLTINKLPQNTKQVINDQKQNRQSIKVSPLNDGSAIETAKIYQGMIRNIEQVSSADIAYDAAFEGAVNNGFGYFRFITEYCDSHSFDQELKIKAIHNPMSVYFDPNSQEPDGSDANWAFVFEDLGVDDFNSQYKGSKLSTMSDWRTIGDREPNWFTGKSVRVAEYFYKTFKEVTLCLLSTGETVEKSKLKDVELPPEVTVLKERVTILPAIKWVKMNGIEVLDQADWLGKWIPIVPVYGDKLIVEGRKIVESVIRHAKDPQRMHNVWRSAETETIGLAPKAPWIIAEGQLEGYEEQWRTSNTRTHAFLPYKPITVAGQPVPPPQRNVYEAPIAAITQASLNSSEDIKATTGMYDASLGARSNETSGRAIQSRANQAQTSNFHFSDNMAKSLRHGGRIAIDLIPKVYDAPRVTRIIHEDGESEIIRINETFRHQGENKLYDIANDTAKYDITVSTGPSFSTKRQEARESMLEFVRVHPPAAQATADLIAKNMDWPGAQEFSERLKKALPPEFQENEGDKPIPPQIKAQLAQMNQMIEMLTNELNEKSKLIEMKTLELESKERIENLKVQANIEIEMAKMGSTEAIELLRQEVAQIEQRLALLNQFQPINEIENEAGSQGALPEQTPDMTSEQPMGEIP